MNVIVIEAVALIGLSLAVVITTRDQVAFLFGLFMGLAWVPWSLNVMSKAQLALRQKKS